MKTILVVYTNRLLNHKETQTKKRYSFNTCSKLKVGDLIESDDYITSMQVIEVLRTCYKYVNLGNGDLSNKRTASTLQVEIRTLKLEDEKAETIIYARKI